MTRDSLRAVIVKVNCSEKTKHCVAKIQFWDPEREAFLKIKKMA